MAVIVSLVVVPREPSSTGVVLDRPHPVRGEGRQHDVGRHSLSSFAECGSAGAYRQREAASGASGRGPKYGRNLPAASRRLAASSVAEIASAIPAPCVL